MVLQLGSRYRAICEIGELYHYRGSNQGSVNEYGLIRTVKGSHVLEEEEELISKFRNRWSRRLDEYIYALPRGLFRVLGTSVAV